jgi:cobalt-zinc-cadmium efflux system outer membrane protein
MKIIFQTTFPLGTALVLGFVPLAQAADAPFAPVAQSVRQQTGRTVGWQLDAAAREQAQAQVRAALRRPLTLPVAVQIALLNNRGLQATFEEIGLSHAELRQARVLSNPEVDFAAKFPDREPRSAKLEWTLAQNFVDVVMLPMRTRIARQQLAAAQLRVSDEVVKLVAEVKSAFFTVQADEAIIGRLRAMREAQRASLEFAQKLHDAGNITDLRLAQEQAAEGQARLDVTMAEAEDSEHREKLNRLLGLSGYETAWRLAGSLPAVPKAEPDLRGVETLAVGRRLDLAAARAEIDSSALSLGQEKTLRFLPSFTLGVTGEREPDGTSLIGPAVRFSLPVFDQGGARVARGESRQRLAERKYEQLSVNLRADVRELRDRLLSQRETARFYREEVLPTRQRILSLTLLNYNAMLTGAFELFNAKREEIEAERAALKATRDYWITRAELERAVGGDLDGRRPDAKALKAASAPAKTPATNSNLN